MQILKEKIQDYLRTTDKSIKSLERESGLGINSLHNILTDKSKNPTIDSIIKIANVLDCSLDELFGREEFLEHYNTKKPLESVPYSNELFLSIVQYINHYLQNNNITQINTNNILEAVTKIYEYCYSNNNLTFDPKFADWFLKNYLV